MKILVINAGSSSMKYQLINMRDEALLAKGLVDRIGLDGSFIKHSKANGETVIKDHYMKDHTVAIKHVIDMLVSEAHGVIESCDEIIAVGHRVVHGGEKFSDAVIINEEVMDAIKDCIDIAPLHNPPNIVGIEACEAVMPGIPMVAVFDTSFHQTLPQEAYIYALPYEQYEKHRIRKYGFHGTSHKFIAQQAAEMLGKPIESLKIITCHLGNGSSITAVNGGRSVDTSMGFTPLQGLAMGTRSGTIDPAIVTFLMENEKLTVSEVNAMLNKKSGMLGISGVSSDFRDLDDAIEEGNQRAQLAINVFCYQIKKTIGEYAAAMNGVDVVVFAGGVGENNVVVRNGALKNLEFLGIEIDDEANDKARGVAGIITKPNSKTMVMVVPTNEELAIARETKKLVMPV
ncbi:MAG: acetate kinase [Clostridia bacterium]